MKIGFTFLLLWASIVGVVGQNWEQAMQKEGVTVWTRKLNWSQYKEFKGETVINSGLSDILSVFDDVTTYTHWIHNCIEALQISRESAFRGVRYTAIKAPWPVSDRDVVFKYTISQDPISKVVTLKLIGQKGLLPDKGRVRMTYMISSYQFIPLSKKETKVIYQSHNDPAGSIPTALINKMITETPFNTLVKLRKFVTSGNYKKQLFKEIKEF